MECDIPGWAVPWFSQDIPSIQPRGCRVKGAMALVVGAGNPRAGGKP